MKSTGKVYIVGAGPGAADLITLKGLRTLHRADVVFYDALVNPELLSEAREGASLVFVGKRCGTHALAQQEINRRIIQEALAGRTVVRLKGGDPLVFGRGGEEALACREAGIPFELVPGISSALGAASYSGIPLTHRRVAASVAFATAHADGPDSASERRLIELARAADTLVIFMGGSRLQSIADSLISGGIARTLPAAAVSQATLGCQRTVLATLETIAERTAAAGLTTPLLIILGKVASLSSSLNWFESVNQARELEQHWLFASVR